MENVHKKPVTPAIPENKSTVWRIDPHPSFEFSSADMRELLGMLIETLPAVAETFVKDLSYIAGRYIEGLINKLVVARDTPAKGTTARLVKAAEILRLGLSESDELFHANLAMYLQSDLLGVSGPDRLTRLMIDLARLPSALEATGRISGVSRKINDRSTLHLTVMKLADLYESATGRAFTNTSLEYQVPTSEAGKFIVAFFAKVHGGQSLEHSLPLAKLIGIQASTIELNKALAAAQKSPKPRQVKVLNEIGISF